MPTHVSWVPVFVLYCIVHYALQKYMASTTLPTIQIPAYQSILGVTAFNFPAETGLTYILVFHKSLGTYSIHPPGCSITLITITSCISRYPCTISPLPGWICLVLATSIPWDNNIYIGKEGELVLHQQHHHHSSVVLEY